MFHLRHLQKWRVKIKDQKIDTEFLLRVVDYFTVSDKEKENMLKRLLYERRKKLEAIDIEMGFKELRKTYGIEG